MMMKRWGIPAAAALLAVAASLYFYAELPEMMAIHFGPSDDPDRYASKAVGAFLLPAVIFLVSAVTNLSGKLERDESKRKRFADVNDTVNVVIALLLLAVHLITLAFNLGYEISPSMFAPLAVGIVFIAIGNVMPRAPQGTLKLFRLKEENYARYARFHGRFMVLAGFLIVLSTLLPGMFGMYFMFLVIAALVVSVIGSAAYFNR
ncbi:DUF1648 domain-containing protein [Paenibacillus sp.]|uniref:DUF1648 domain-containing protein n=1 Tax=Paenibacillus sp. TaxID=58172 RepID=UPI0028117CCD|nr:DUF1648 domain-containing protein [Paenibacillus sp.]